jgi:hypothetical protein
MSGLTRADKMSPQSGHPMAQMSGQGGHLMAQMSAEP